MLVIFILIWGCFHCIIIRSRGQVYQSMTQKHWDQGFWVEHHLFDYLAFHKEFNHLWTTKLWIYLYHLIINEYIPINQLNDKANEYDKIENKSSCKVKRSWCQVIDQNTQRHSISKDIDGSMTPCSKSDENFMVNLTESQTLTQRGCLCYAAFNDLVIPIPHLSDELINGLNVNRIKCEKIKNPSSHSHFLMLFELYASLSLREMPIGRAL